MPIIGIYKITNPTGKIYIGQSKEIRERMLSYKRLDCEKQYKIYNSLKKYGWVAHTFEVIEECTVEDLNKRERYWQDFYDVLNREKGLNLTLVDTEEEPRVLSEETREKMRESGKVKIFTEEHRENLAKVWRGRKHTEETKKKQSDAHKGEKSHRYGKPAWNKGKKLPHLRGENNGWSKLVMCTATGIFYYSRREAAASLGITEGALGHMLRGSVKNRTTLIDV